MKIVCIVIITLLMFLVQYFLNIPGMYIVQFLWHLSHKKAKEAVIKKHYNVDKDFKYFDFYKYTIDNAFNDTYNKYPTVFHCSLEYIKKSL